MKNLLFVILLLLSKTVLGQFYNGSNQDFGKNRVQYGTQKWKSFNYEGFQLYFYRGGEELTEYVSQVFQKELLEAQYYFGLRLDGDVEILVFNTLQEFRQSNVGQGSDAGSDVGGVNQLVNGKIFIYNSGERGELESQVKRQVAELFLRKMFAGQDWRSTLSSEFNEKFPRWLIESFKQYYSNEFDAITESNIKDGYLNKDYRHFSKLAENQKIEMGISIWQYIELNFGESAVQEVIKLIGLSSNVKNGFIYSVGADLNEIRARAFTYYTNLYIEDNKVQDEIDLTYFPKLFKKSQVISSVCLSNNGDKIAYSISDRGRTKLLVYDKVLGEDIVLFKYGFRLNRIQDFGNPKLAFHPEDKSIVSVIESEGELLIKLYSFEDREVIDLPVPDLDRILSVNYHPNGQWLILSAIQHGKTDLYEYRISGRSLKQITCDGFDDLDPVYSLDGKSLIFSSNRRSDTLFIDDGTAPFSNSLDLFQLELNRVGKKVQVLKRLTDTPSSNERNPNPINNGSVIYITDENGLDNAFELSIDSSIVSVDTLIHYRYFSTKTLLTNYTTSIHQLHVNSSGSIIASFYQNGISRIYMGDNFKLPSSQFTSTKRKQILEDGKVIIRTVNQNDSEINTEDYQFLNQGVIHEEFLDVSDNASIDILPYEKSEKNTYTVNFASENSSFQLSNTFLNPVYQRYYGVGSEYVNPNVGLTQTFTFSDAFEDYRIIGGFRMPIDFKSNELLIGAEFNKKRNDQDILFSRSKNETVDTETGDVLKIITFNNSWGYKIPISEVLSVKTNLQYRVDKKVYLNYDDPSLLRETEFNHQVGGVVNIVFDNSKMINQNAYEGIKAKFFSDFLYDVSVNKYMVNLGIDLRKGINIYKGLVWMNRFSSASSFGSQKLLYYLGGVNSPIIRPLNYFNKDLEVDPDQNFAYQTITNPMRGFGQNARNGNSFVLLNSELRIPVFSIFSKNPISNYVLRSIQFVAFYETGSAFTGVNPYSENNFFNIETIENGPVTIKIKNGRNPFVHTFGGGVRAKLFSYFLKLDAGWGVEAGNVNQKPKLYFTFGYDF